MDTSHSNSISLPSWSTADTFVKLSELHAPPLKMGIIPASSSPDEVGGARVCKAAGLVLAIQNAPIHVGFSFSPASALFYSFTRLREPELPQSRGDATGSNMPKAEEQRKEQPKPARPWYS